MKSNLKKLDFLHICWQKNYSVCKSIGNNKTGNIYLELQNADTFNCGIYFAETFYSFYSPTVKRSTVKRCKIDRCVLVMVPISKKN